MHKDRLTSIRIRGMRSLADVTLPLDGLTVLIGDNGTGKSTILEALVLLSGLARDPVSDVVHERHGGLSALLRRGEKRLEFVVTAEGEEGALHYTVQLMQGDGVLHLRENVAIGGRRVARRSGSAGEIWEPQKDESTGHADLDSDRTLLASFGSRPPQPAFARLRTLLLAIDVHLAFDALPYWAGRMQSREAPLRQSAIIRPVDGLSRFGTNLANAWHALRNQSESAWQETMALVRLGLGEDVESVVTPADPGGGRIAIGLSLRGLGEPVPAFALSDGQLTWLAFVALYRLNRNRSLLAFDEPELHLHPALLMRVVGFFEDMARDMPVLLSTHSDRLLDGLSDPAASVILCELDENRATRLWRPDAEALGKWLERYRGLGELRAEGYERAIMTREVGRDA